MVVSNAAASTISEVATVTPTALDTESSSGLHYGDVTRDGRNDAMSAARLLAVMLIVFSSCRPAPSSSHAGVAMTTKVVEEHSDVAIRFEITNGTSEPLVVVDRFLPWGGNAANWGDDPALDMRAVDSSGRELPKQYPVRELGPDATTTIAPGATAAGTLRPSHYFADFAETLGRSEIRVEWKYRLNAIGRCEMLFRGATELPRR